MQYAAVVAQQNAREDGGRKITKPDTNGILLCQNCDIYSPMIHTGQFTCSPSLSGIWTVEKWRPTHMGYYDKCTDQRSGEKVILRPMYLGI